MKYIMMMSGTMHQWKHDFLQNWPSADVEAHMAFLRRFNQQLTEAGELVEIKALAGAEETRIVRADADGSPAVTDGPFPESKEFLAGYWIIDVESPERAYELAAQASAAPGRGGEPLNMPIELRPMMTGPGEEM